MTPEAKVVQRIKALVKSHGGEVRKVEWSGRRGAPDLLVLMPGFHLFVEAKAEGERPRPEQLREHKRLEKAGFVVLVVEGAAGVKELTDILELEVQNYLESLP